MNDPSTAMARDSLIRARGLRKSFGSKTVLDGIDLEIPTGSVVGLLGRNGAGKSTLLKCLLGLLRIDAGEATVLGLDPWELDADAKTRLGFVPQSIELYPWLTVQQTLDYVGSFYPLWNRPFAMDTARKWDLELADRVGTLSHGQAQTLGIVLALGHEPELLVLDEPAASLDPAARREFLAMMLQSVAELGQTVLFSTHITSDVERCADRVAILRAGKIQLHEELDVLKDSVKRIRLIAKHDLPRDMRIEGALAVRVRANEATLSRRDCDAAFVARLEREWNAQAEVLDLNLEDIFLELHHA